MGIIEYYNIQEKVRKLRKHIDSRGCLELLAEESSEVTQAAMKFIRVSEASNDKVYPANKKKYTIKNCEVDLNNEIMDVITCVFLLQAANYDVSNSLMDYDVINERLDKMIARIEENKNDCIGSCDNEFVKDPVKVTVKYDGQTYDVINKYESKSVRSFDLRATDNNADPVNHPNHYEMVGPFESFDIIVESLGIYGARQFCQGNIIKYQTRYKEKNGEEDLKKRHWYDRMDQMLAKCNTIEDYYKLKESDF